MSSVIKEAVVHYLLAPINLAPTTYRVVHTFKNLNKIYETKISLPKFRALDLLKTISVVSWYFFWSYSVERWNRSWIRNLSTKDKDYNRDMLRVIGQWEGDINGHRVAVKPTAYMTLSDPAHKVGMVRTHLINKAYIVIPDVHKDWSWIIYRDWDKPEGLKDVVKKCPNEPIKERIGD